MMEFKKKPYTLEKVKEKPKIKSFLDKRNINSIYHFTSTDNLGSILLKGLVARKFLNCRYRYNDTMRLEGKLDYNCVSIGFPNYKMFFKYRQKPNVKGWCVIELDSKVLYEKQCLFCIENAASNNEKKRNEKDKIGIKGLEALYYNDTFRRQLGITSNMPTNPQAEVLVYGKIEPKYIKKIYFDDYYNYNKFKNKVKSEINGKYFKYRCDYTHW